MIEAREKMKLTDEDRATYQRIAAESICHPQSAIESILRDFIAELSYVAGMRAGLERGAKYMEEMYCGQANPKATALRTLAKGEEPCDDCGYPLPSHDPACVARSGP